MAETDASACRNLARGIGSGQSMAPSLTQNDWSDPESHDDPKAACWRNPKEASSFAFPTQDNLKAQGRAEAGDEDKLYQAFVKNTFIQTVDVGAWGEVLKRSASDSDLSRSSGEEKMKFWLPSGLSSASSSSTDMKQHRSSMPLQQWQSYALTGRLSDNSEMTPDVFCMPEVLRPQPPTDMLDVDGFQGGWSPLPSPLPRRTPNSRGGNLGTKSWPPQGDIAALASPQPSVAPSGHHWRGQHAGQAFGAPGALDVFGADQATPGSVLGLPLQAPPRAPRGYGTAPLVGGAAPLSSRPPIHGGLLGASVGNRPTDQTSEPLAQDLQAAIMQSRATQLQRHENGEKSRDMVVSIGSAKHATGECSPCLFWFRKSCAKGAHCDYCHFRHKGQRNKRIRPSKKTRMQMRAFSDARGQFDGGSDDGSYEDDDVAEAFPAAAQDAHLALGRFSRNSDF